MVFPINKISAIFGKSGSGKSTIVDLLFRLFYQDKGEIRVNGINLNEINLQSWRKMIGYVSQDVFLFNGTIAENISMGSEKATMEDVINASKLANSHEFIKKLSNGYNTLLSDRGFNLSGGQRQRIAIARALVRNPKILIFDEATSALDSESERIIYNSITTLSKTKTIIIISHDLRNFKNIDIVYHMENGRCTIQKQG